MRVGGQRHASAALPTQRPGTHSIGGRLGPRAGVDGAKNPAPTGTRSPDRPARSESAHHIMSICVELFRVCTAVSKQTCCQ